MPKPRDIGLIFDVTLENVDEGFREILTLRIRANGHCCANVTPDIAMLKMGRIVGGNFGFLKPGATEKVSLIWPTVALYNRVGFCPIVITSTNFLKNEKQTIKQRIKFDTRAQILYYDNHTSSKQTNIFDCQNWDNNFFKNCKPIVCKNRYAGLRNFYNTTSKLCEEMPRCSEKYLLYDICANKCIDKSVHLSEEGKFDKSNFVEQNNSNYCTINEIPYNDYSNGSAVEHVNKDNWLNGNRTSTWLLGLCEGLLIVFATIIIYLLICFSIVLFVTWLSRRSDRRGDSSGRGIILESRLLESSEDIVIYSTTSLMSQR